MSRLRFFGIMAIVAAFSFSGTAVAQADKPKPAQKLSSAAKWLSSSIEMVFVEGGTFTMGCTPEQGDNCDDDEKPAHQVTLSDFHIGKYEVTQAQWKAVMGKIPGGIREVDDLPVTDVSWNDAQEFIKKLNEMTGDNYRLPTEAEWEYAARGGNQSKGYRFSGSNFAEEVRAHDSSGSVNRVGTKKSNELGIHDMSGNAWEWVLDLYGKYNASAQTNPQGALLGKDHVYRGGVSDAQCRVSNRGNGDHYYSDFYLHDPSGFRLARGRGVVMDATAYLNRGMAYVKEKEYNKAIADFTEAIRLNPKNAEYYYNRGEAYRVNRDYNSAIADYEEVLRIDPNHANARIVIVAAQTGIEAIKTAQVSARAQEHYKNGITYTFDVGRENYDKAIAEFTEAIRLNPKNAEYYYNRGRAYVKRGKIPIPDGDFCLAIADYEEALRINPNHKIAPGELNSVRQALSSEGFGCRLEADH